MKEGGVRAMCGGGSVRVQLHRSEQRRERKDGCAAPTGAEGCDAGRSRGGRTPTRHTLRLRDSWPRSGTLSSPRRREQGAVALNRSPHRAAAPPSSPASSPLRDVELCLLPRRCGRIARSVRRGLPHGRRDRVRRAHRTSATHDGGRFCVHPLAECLSRTAPHWPAGPLRTSIPAHRPKPLHRGSAMPATICRRRWRSFPCSAAAAIRVRGRTAWMQPLPSLPRTSFQATTSNRRCCRIAAPLPRRLSISSALLLRACTWRGIILICSSLHRLPRTPPHASASCAM